jgi:hypothetical protein
MDAVKFIRRITMRKWAWMVMASLIVAGAAPGMSAAAEKGGNTGSISRRLISMEFRTLGGMRYLYGDKRLRGCGDFEDVIFKAGDPEATRMIRTSRSSRNASTVLGLLGVSAFVASILTLPDGHDVFDDGTDTSNALLAGGACLLMASDLYQKRMETARFNAVQRYNQVVLKAKVASF